MANSVRARLLLPLVVIALIVSACGAPSPVATEPAPVEAPTEVPEEPTAVPEPTEVPPEAPPEPTEAAPPPTEVPPEPTEEPTEPAPTEEGRTGAWIDEVIVIEEPSADAAVSRMQAGEIDLYAYQVTNAEVARVVEESEDLDLYRSFGSYNELTFNPVGPEFADGRLNPFSVPAIREAMNWLLDREYIAQEIFDGMAVPRWLPFNNASNDYALLADVARRIEFEYAYDKEKAAEIITAEMEALGAVLEDGAWTYNGAPVELILLIRTEDERRGLGDYVANQLEDIGFTTVRDYKTGAEASPIWMSGDPTEGGFHIYTGGWVTTVVPRNLADNFAYFYTGMGLPSPLWQAYENDPEFYELSQRLEQSDYQTLEERRDLMAQALDLAMKDANRIWLVDRASITPERAEVTVAADLYGGVSGSWLWPVTIRREGEVGGSMTIAMPSILPEPWNPIAGSNWIYDMMLIRSTGEMGYVPDPFTGLWWPRRFDRAEITMQEGLPVGKTHDWVDLAFEPEIAVPEDAWADWDPVEQRFLTVAEVYDEPVTVARKSVVYYPEDLYETVTWHDGSSFSIGDVLMGMILNFDRAKQDSPYYDASAVPAYDSFMSAFRGVRIVSEDPLVIETYSDFFQLDAELNATSWWPYFNQGQGAWHTLALGLTAEENGRMAFSSAKAKENDVEWTGYVSGPTVAMLVEELAEASEAGSLPYAEFLGEYITGDEIAARYANLQQWYDTYGHLWVGTGPMYLVRAYPVEGQVELARYEAYSDDATRWERFSAPAIAEVEVDGPGMVAQGTEAVFEVWVTFEGEPYPAEDIAEVKFLVFDSAGQLAVSEAATLVEDGLWEIVLTPEMTAELAEGSTRLEAVVVSKMVALPSFSSMQFVVAE